MIRNYKYKLYVSKHTRELSRLVTSSNFAWNHIVRFCRRYYKIYHQGITCVELQKHMAKLAKRDTFWSKLDAQTMQSISQKYDATLKQHFKQKQRGFPRTHKPHNNGSILFKQTGYRLVAGDSRDNRGMLFINKISKHHGFRFKITRPWGDVKNITVKRDYDNTLWLIVTCDVPEEHIERVEDKGAIGIDFGLKTFITTSDSEYIQIPDYHKQALSEIKKVDRLYSLRCNVKVYGTSFKRVKKTKFKTHRRIANLRSDFHWKTAHELCKKHSFIAIEDLNLKGMQRHRRWGRKVSSLGIGEFVQKLQVVAEKYGTTVYKIDRFAPSSQICNKCGYKNIDTKNLTLREWICPVCGEYHDRDVNAAKNIRDIACEEIKNGKGISRGKSDSKPSTVKEEVVMLTA